MRLDTYEIGESAEIRALRIYGGERHVPYLHGKRVYEKHGKGCTIPDIVRIHNGVFEAIEVKHWNYKTLQIGALCNLRTQLEKRKSNLPIGAKQRAYILLSNVPENEDIEDLHCWFRQVIDMQDVAIDIETERREQA